MGGAASRIFTHVFQDAAVHRLANSKVFQQLALKTHDTVTAAQRHLETTAKQTADNPAEVARAVSEGATDFWENLKKHVMTDVSKMTGGSSGTTGRTSAKGGGSPLS